MEYNTQNDGKADYVALTTEGDLLAEFCISGITKRFVRIHTGRGMYHRYSPSRVVSTSVFLEQDVDERYNLIVEIHENSYQSTYELRRCVVDSFIGTDSANAALHRIKNMLGMDASLTKTHLVDNELERIRRGSSWEAVCTIAIVIAAGALALGAVGLGLGGWAVFTTLR